MTAPKLPAWAMTAVAMASKGEGAEIPARLLPLAGRIAFVTGAGSGIGRAVAIHLARCGASVASVDWNADAARETATWINTRLDAADRGGKARAYQVDVSKESQVREAVKAAEDDFDSSAKLYTAVNCAGITMDKFMTKMEEGDWDRVMNVNLKGTFFVTKAVSQAIILKQQQASKPEIGLGGSIINVASIVGKTGNLGQANYSASKGGVVSFTKTAALELARNQIRVNAVLPGFISTPMVDAVPEKVKMKILPTIPLGGLGQPEHIAEVVAFLVSDSSAYMTGATVEVTGGFNM